MREEWRSITGYEGLYEVSNLGGVRSLVRMTKRGRRGGRRLKTSPNVYSGYLAVSLSAENRQQVAYIHALVLEAFVGPRPPGMEACHGDGDRKNCRLDNLRWDTRKNNHKDKIAHGTQTRGENHPVSILKERDIPKIFALRKQGKLLREIAAIFGVSDSQISLILLRREWKHVEI